MSKTASAAKKTVVVCRRKILKRGAPYYNPNGTVAKFDPDLAAYLDANRDDIVVIGYCNNRRIECITFSSGGSVFRDNTRGGKMYFMPICVGCNMSGRHYWSIVRHLFNSTTLNLRKEAEAAILFGSARENIFGSKPEDLPMPRKQTRLATAAEIAPE